MCETIKCLPSFMQQDNSCTIALIGVSASRIVLVGLGALGLLTLEGFLPCALPLIGIGGSMTLSGLITLCVKNCKKGGSSFSAYETSSSEPDGKSQSSHSSEIKDPPEQESQNPVTPIRKTPSKVKTRKKDSPKIPKNEQSAYVYIKMKKMAMARTESTPFMAMPSMPSLQNSQVSTNSSIGSNPSPLRPDHKRDTVYAKGFVLTDPSQSEPSTPPSTSANYDKEKTSTVYKDVPLGKKPDRLPSSTVARKLFVKDASPP